MSEKRPPWYKIRERAEFDALHRTYEEMKARVLTPDEVQQFDVSFPPNWKNQPLSWVKNTLGIGEAKGVPEGSGAGYVQSPFTDIFTRQYGVSPTADLYKYRQIIRSQPDVQQAIQLTVSMAIGKGFTIEHPKKNIQKFLNKFSDKANLLQEMLVLGQDMLGYGTAFAEIQWSDKAVEKEQIYSFDSSYVSKSEVFKWDLNGKVSTSFMPSFIICPEHGLTEGLEQIGEAKKCQCKLCNQKLGSQDIFTAEVVTRTSGSGSSEGSEDEGDKSIAILGLKPLDPVYMRVRRDSFGNIFGFIQYMSAPPVLLDVQNVVYIKFRPHSTGYENAYGQSILLSLIRTNALLEQFESDAAVWIHSRAVPPLIAKGGSDPQHPYSTKQMTDLLGKLAGRTAASIIAVKSDVELQELMGVTRNLNLQWWLDYLIMRRNQALGIPPILMGVPDSSNAQTGEVVFQDFITRCQLIQKLLSDAVEAQVLWPLAKARFGDDVEKPVMVWKPIVEEDRNMRAQRLIQALQAKAISVNEFRQAIGFERIDGKPELDDVGQPPLVPATDFSKTSAQPGQKPGFPPKPGQPGQQLPPQTPKIQLPPAGVRKKEDMEQELRIKKMRLLVAQENFKEELLDVVKWAKFELQQGDKIVKEVKQEAMERAGIVINRYVADAFLYGKLDSLYNKALKEGTEITMELFSLSKEELSGVVKLKEKYISDFDSIVSDMIKAKENQVVN